jgi:hypothetical protein
MDGQEDCPNCHTALWALGLGDAGAATPLAATTQGDSVVAVANCERQDVSLPPSRGQMVLLQTESLVATAVAATQAILSHVIPARISVHGRVIIVEAPYSEHPDGDVCKVITRILWIILLVLSPVLIPYWLVVRVGGLPALLAFVGLFLLFKLLSPMNLYAMFRIFSVLKPAARDSAGPVTVRYFRLREEGSDAEVMVRMKGQFTHGNVGLEDIVTLSGRSRGGTLYAQEGYNHRTASTIRLERSHSWVGLVLTVFFILALVVEFHAPIAKVARAINSLGGAR